MKTVTAFCIAFLIAFQIPAQPSFFFKYQAVARDGSGTVLAGKTVGFQISILKNSPTGLVVYREIHQKSTNPFGLVDLEIGNGTPGSGEFDKIDWGSDTFFIKIEMDPAGGISFQPMGTSQLLSVPYALFARNVLNNNDADADSTNELQKLSFSGGILSLSKNGGSFALPTNLPGDAWGNQTVVSDSTLTGNGTATSPLKLASRSAISGQVLKWNGSAWKPAPDETGQGGTGTTGPAGGDLTGSYPDPVIGTAKINSAKIVDKSILAIDLADSVVTSTKIYPSAVTTAKIDTSAVTSDKLAAASVSTVKIAPGAVTGDKISRSGAITGQTLKWNGSAWSPADDVVGSSFSLPFSGTVNATATALSVTNTGSTDYSSAISGSSSAATKLTYGVRGSSSSVNGTGVFGEANATDGLTSGVYGFSASPSGRGVVGYSQAVSGNTTGVLGISNSAEGQGIWGKSEATSGNGYGVVGSSLSPAGYGVYGTANSSTGLNFGLFGSTRSDAGTGIYGIAENTSGTTFGIKGKVESKNGFSGHFTGGKFFIGSDAGIGTENPGARLEVNGQVKITGGNPGTGKILTSDANGLASWSLPFTSVSLPFYGSNSTDTSLFKIVNTSTSALNNPVGISGFSSGVSGVGLFGKVTATTGLGKGVMGEVVSPDAFSGYFTGGRFYVNGNVGIGTKAPTFKLDVMGDRIRLSNPSGSYVALRTDERTGFVNLYYSCANMIIQGSAPGENLLINPESPSKVGIRTWTPIFDLDVNGDIRATGSVYYGGTSGGGTATPYDKPDYVFEKTYGYLQVEEVEKFLHAEKHLPWVTSLKEEKEENGETINMTRMAFETLESVENLQLQIIGQQKLIKTLMDQNAKLTSENEQLKEKDNSINNRIDKLEKLLSKRGYQK